MYRKVSLAIITLFLLILIKIRVIFTIFNRLSAGTGRDYYL